MNQAAYSAFWHFINERHAIYLKKSEGLEKPWTTDPVLRDWKFCNVFRILDKQSQLLLEHVITPHVNDSSAHLLFNIFVFRAFNLYDTYKTLGWSSFWDPEAAIDLLAYRVGSGLNLTSGAYMIRGREGMPKYRSIVKSLTEIWEAKHDLVEYLASERSLEYAFDAIMDCKFWGWGEFTSYQVVLDLTYTPILANAEDINTWCAFGPGAIRGIHLLFDNWHEMTPLACAQYLLEESPKHIGSHVPPLTLQDIEFSLCELQKYWRIQTGGKSKERYNGAY